MCGRAEKKKQGFAEAKCQGSNADLPLPKTGKSVKVKIQGYQKQLEDSQYGPKSFPGETLAERWRGDNLR